MSVHDETPAETIRRAIVTLQERAASEKPAPPGEPRPDVALAMAEHLRRSASDLWAFGPLCECADGCDLCDDVLWMPHARAALRLARTYLGETP